MEGTSSTLYHLNNGLTWALLMNAWAKDTDYDGLIKYALSTVPGLPMWHGVSMKDNDEFLVVSADCVQCVRILLPHSELMSHTTMMKSLGYKLSHINTLSYSNNVLFNVVWNKSRKIWTDWFIHMDISVENFDSFVHLVHENGLYTSFLESYVLKGEMYHIFVLETGADIDQKVYCVENKAFHRKIFSTYFEMGYTLKSQCILEYDDKVLVSAVYDKVSYDFENFGPLEFDCQQASQ